MIPFLASVTTLAAIASAEALLHQMHTVSADFLLLLVLACVAAPHTLDLGHNARLSTLQPFLLAAIVLFGVKEAVAVAALSMTYFWLVGRPRLHPIKTVFNLCNFVLASWLGGHVFFLSGGRLGDVSSPESLVALLLTTLIFFVVHTGLMSIVVGIEQKIDPFRVWYEKFSWTLNTQLMGASLVILLGMLRPSFGAQVLFLILPFCIMTYQFFKAYFVRTSQRGHRA